MDLMAGNSITSYSFHVKICSLCMLWGVSGMTAGHALSFLYEAWQKDFLHFCVKKTKIIIFSLFPESIENIANNMLIHMIMTPYIQMDFFLNFVIVMERLF